MATGVYCIVPLLYITATTLAWGWGGHITNSITLCGGAQLRDDLAYIDYLSNEVILLTIQMGATSPSRHSRHSRTQNKSLAYMRMNVTCKPKTIKRQRGIKDSG
jgi:hypothetical protein